MQQVISTYLCALAVASTILFFGYGRGAAIASDGALKALIVTGQSRHGWRDSSRDFEVMLERTGRFEADISVSPPGNATADAWDAWRPAFADYDVIVLEYTGEDWPEHLKRSLEAFIDQGGGMFLAHSVVGAFDNWSQYQEMIGMGFNPPDAGGRFIFDESVGEFVRLPNFHGAGAGHGKQHAFSVTSRVSSHPILQGLPSTWMQATDELYHGMRGPAQNMEVLATAFSEAEQWGSGQHEPVLWTVNYGKGRVVVTVLGHRMSDSFRYDPERHELDHGANGKNAVHSVGFQTLLVRGAEWAAIGAVTISAPLEFPTIDGITVVPPDEVSWC